MRLHHTGVMAVSVLQADKVIDARLHEGNGLAMSTLQVHELVRVRRHNLVPLCLLVVSLVKGFLHRIHERCNLSLVPLTGFLLLLHGNKQGSMQTASPALAGPLGPARVRHAELGQAEPSASVLVSPPKLALLAVSAPGSRRAIACELCLAEGSIRVHIANAEMPGKDFIQPR